jgi:hypothetical protein
MLQVIFIVASVFFLIRWAHRSVPNTRITLHYLSRLELHWWFCQHKIVCDMTQYKYLRITLILKTIYRITLFVSFCNFQNIQLIERVIVVNANSAIFQLQWDNGEGRFVQNQQA